MKITSLLALFSVVILAAAPGLGLEAAVAISAIAGVFSIAAADYGRTERSLSRVSRRSGSLGLAA
jgi:hypothetical protein